MKILYVENHGIFATQVSQRFLSAHLVRVVPSLALARDALSKDHFDLLIVDYDLDDGKGDAFVGEARGAYPDLKIVASSSHEAGNAALMKAGANAVCGKMDFENINAVIAGLI